MDTDIPSNGAQLPPLDDGKHPQVLIQSPVKPNYQNANYFAMINQNHQHNQMYNNHIVVNDERFVDSRPHQQQSIVSNVMDLDQTSTSSSKLLPTNHTKSSQLVDTHLPHYLYNTNTTRSKPSFISKPTRHLLPKSVAKDNQSFNPYADENDHSANHFQLSKTSADKKTNASPSRSVESSPFSRTFGFNRTNLIWTGNPGLKVESQSGGQLATHLHTSPNVSRFQIRTSCSSSRSPNGDSTRSQAFRPLLPVDASGRPSGKGNSPFRNRANDQMTFKCFDLSDEAGWLNFDQ